jgi:hypothetical protein
MEKVTSDLSGISDFAWMESMAPVWLDGGIVLCDDVITEDHKSDRRDI